MANLVTDPYPVYFDASGDPVEDGYILIGQPGLSPITNPLQAYWDSDLSNPATNIRTKGGRASNSGTPARLYTATNYSIIVQDKNQQTIYTQLDSVDYINSASGSNISSVETIADLRGILPTGTNIQASVGGSATEGDGRMGSMYYWNASSSATDNGASVIEPTSSVGNGRWLWINTNAPKETANISATATLDLAFMNRIFLVDTALAVVATIPDGDFQGQEIELSNRGASTLEIIGTGIPADTFVLSEVLLTWLGAVWSFSFRGTDVSVLGDLATDDITERTSGEGVSFGSEVKWKYHYQSTGGTEDDLFTFLETVLPNNGDFAVIHGHMEGAVSTDNGYIMGCLKTTPTQYTFRMVGYNSNAIIDYQVDDGAATIINDIELMINFDPLN